MNRPVDRDKPDLDLERLVRGAARAADGVLTAVGAVLGALDRSRAARVAAPRLARVAAEAGHIAARTKIERARRQVAGAFADPGGMDAVHERSAQRLAALCRELGGGVLKIGQFLSTRPDLLPPAYVRELSRLQDSALPAPIDAIRARIAAELGDRAAAFAAIDDAPLATASLAQVHAASLADGTEVVIKVQLPGVDDLIAADMAALPAVASLLGELCPWIDAPTTAAELARSIQAELDFAAEAAMARRIADAFRGDPAVIVPAVIDSLSTPRMITMQRVRGERLGDYLATAPATDRDQLLGTLVAVYARQILELGLFQADPHPGNFLVAPGPTLALLDFGSVGRLSPAERAAYARLIVAAVARDHGAIAAILGELGFAGAGDDAARRWAELVANLIPTADDLAAIDPEAELERMLAVARDNPIARVPPSFVLVARVLASLGGLISHHRPALDVARVVYGSIRQQSVS